jgi:hypothetical protein
VFDFVWLREQTHRYVGCRSFGRISIINFIRLTNPTLRARMNLFKYPGSWRTRMHAVLWRLERARMSKPTVK